MLVDLLDSRSVPIALSAIGNTSSQTMKGHRMSNVDTVRVERAPLDIGLAEVLHAALTALWRRKLLVGAIVASSVSIGSLTIFLIPTSYTPTAFIRGGFVVSNAVARDEDSKEPYVGLDLTRMIETQSRLLQSEDLARRVVR